MPFASRPRAARHADVGAAGRRRSAGRGRVCRALHGESPVAASEGLRHAEAPDVAQTDRRFTGHRRGAGARCGAGLPASARKRHGRATARLAEALGRRRQPCGSHRPGRPRRRAIRRRGVGSREGAPERTRTPRRLHDRHRRTQPADHRQRDRPGAAGARRGSRKQLSRNSHLVESATEKAGSAARARRRSRDRTENSELRTENQGQKRHAGTFTDSNDGRNGDGSNRAGRERHESSTSTTSPAMSS